MKPVTIPCPDADLLIAWHSGDAPELIDAPELAALAHHCATCQHCLAQVAALDALEADMLALSVPSGPPSPAFTRRVLSALPPQASARAPWAGLAAWWRRQAAAALVALTGLLIMLTTGDALTLLTGGWQQAADWVNAAGTADGGTVTNLLGSVPGAAAAPGRRAGRGARRGHPRPGRGTLRRAGAGQPRPAGPGRAGRATSRDKGVG